MFTDKYDPKIKGHIVGQLVILFCWNFNGDVMSCSEGFETEIVNYILNISETISNNLKIGPMLNNVDGDSALRDHLLMNAARLTSWTLFRKELVEMIRVNKSFA